MGLVSALSICLLAPPIADLIGALDIAVPLMVMSLFLPLATLGTTHIVT